ncbi:hypothetical protein ON010_g9760 [Phytophthora cinnamomi]|nr:hypothetical protein ON010_g9760 [Phytophthora cinnamomi]
MSVASAPLGLGLCEGRKDALAAAAAEQHVVGEAQEDPGHGQGLPRPRQLVLPHGHQPRGEGSAVPVPRPQAEEARHALAVDPEDQRRRAPGGPLVLEALRQDERLGHRAEPQGAGRHGRHGALQLQVGAGGRQAHGGRHQGPVNMLNLQASGRA